MATFSGVSCGSCLKTGKNKVASIWCSDCESGLCGVCRYQHNISNTTINHKTTRVEELYQGAQMPIRSRTMQPRIVHKFDFAKADSPKPEISAFCLHPKKNFVFVDRAGFFTICDKDGSFQERFSMDCMSAYDMVSIDNSTIALASRSEGYVDRPYLRLVDIEKKTNSNIENAHDCMGIAHNKGILYFCAYGRGVLKVKLLDFMVSDFYCPRYYVNFCCGFTLSKSNLCVCDQETDEILLFDLSANILWKFVDKKLLLTPGNVTSDANGNIYVLGLASYNVVFISADGKHSRQLLCREDGIENVVGTHYDKDRKVLKVVNIFGNVIIYNCP